jgi:hypothetical protein
MGSSVGSDRRGLTISDEELLRTIGKDLRSFYADIIRQPLPPKIKAALARIDDENSRDISLSQLHAGAKLVQRISHDLYECGGPHGRIRPA